MICLVSTVGVCTDQIECCQTPSNRRFERPEVRQRSPRLLNRSISGTEHVEQIDGIDLRGWSGPITVQDLLSSCSSELPKTAGVYTVLFGGGSPEFLDKSAAGWYQDRNSSYSARIAFDRWAKGATILYFGMTASRGMLRDRIRKLVDFAAGKPVAHRGGRLLWHLREWRSLQLPWCECPASTARALEASLIESFAPLHEARRPFANMLA
jgi:hypothetical protein